MKILLCLPLLLLLTACVSPPTPHPPHLEHVVMIWLKEPGNQEHRKQITDASKTFAEIPSVRSVRVGEMVPSDRAIVDSTYDLGLIVSVDDEAGLKAYLEHPIHQNAKQQVLMPLIEKIVVYDFKE